MPQQKSVFDRMPAAEKRALLNIGLNIKQGKPEQGYGQPSIASVDTDSPNTLMIHDPSRFNQDPAQVVAHEGMHLWQNNLPPAIQAQIPPDNPKDPYSFTAKGLNDLRARGGTILDLPREIQGRLAQYAVADPNNKPLQQAIAPYLNDMNKIPLSSIMPTDPNQQGINTTPRPPMPPPETYYTDDMVGPGSAPVTLDFSKAQPVQPVTLDFSKAQPVNGAATVPQPGTISAAPGSMPGDSMASKVENWTRNVQNDLKYGTDTTGVGHVLKALGAHGLYSGNSQGVGDFMGSLPLGLAKATQGAAETGQGKIAQGAEDVGAGALQAATIPASFAAPEAADVAPEAAAKAVGVARSAAGKVTPTAYFEAQKAAAGGLLQSVAHDANQVPVKLDNAGDGALALMNWQKKTQLGPTINKFLNRITDPKQGPMTYQEARDYYQLLGKLSVEETNKLAPPVRRNLVQMVTGLKQDIGDAADQVGRAADYYQGMGDYAKAAKYQDWYENAKKIVTPALVKALGTGTTGAVGYKLYNELTK